VQTIRINDFNTGIFTVGRGGEGGYRHVDLSNPTNEAAGKNGYTSYLQTNNDNLESIGGGGGAGIWVGANGTLDESTAKVFAKSGASGGGGFVHGGYGSSDGGIGSYGGTNGNSGQHSMGSGDYSGGGGGAGSSLNQIRSSGSVGKLNNYTGLSNKFYGGGGGGGYPEDSINGNGLDGGGNGARLDNIGSTQGVPNTGGGGGGSSVNVGYKTGSVYERASGQNGGSGIIILKYTI
jgi:hypothetical protein